MKISLVMPVLNEAGIINETLCGLQPMRQRGHELIVVDGGSKDNTSTIAEPLVDRLVTSKPGRAIQMNTGAQQANGDVFWFLHVDTLAPADADRYILDSLEKSGSALQWGRFDVRLSGVQLLLRIVERSMNLRSRITGVATGDQGMFITRELFSSVGGFPEIPIMEDIAMSKCLKRAGRPHCLDKQLGTSSRRWERHGVIRTVLLMWYLRAAYALGVPAERLALLYE